MESGSKKEIGFAGCVTASHTRDQVCDREYSDVTFSEFLSNNTGCIIDVGGTGGMSLGKFRSSEVICACDPIQLYMT